MATLTSFHFVHLKSIYSNVYSITRNMIIILLGRRTFSSVIGRAALRVIDLCESDTGDFRTTDCFLSYQLESKRNYFEERSLHLFSYSLYTLNIWIILFKLKWRTIVYRSICRVGVGRAVSKYVCMHLLETFKAFCERLRNLKRTTSVFHISYTHLMKAVFMLLWQKNCILILYETAIY